MSGAMRPSAERNKGDIKGKKYKKKEKKAKKAVDEAANAISSEQPIANLS